MLQLLHHIIDLVEHSSWWIVYVPENGILEKNETNLYLFIVLWEKNVPVSVCCPANLRNFSSFADDGRIRKTPRLLLLGAHTISSYWWFTKYSPDDHLCWNLIITMPHLNEIHWVTISKKKMKIKKWIFCHAPNCRNCDDIHLKFQKQTSLKFSLLYSCLCKLSFLVVGNTDSSRLRCVCVHDLQSVFVLFSQSWIHV